MGRKTSDLAILPAAGILATHYVHVYMPEQVALTDQDQRISIDSLEDYLLNASTELSLYSGDLGGNPFSGALFSSVSHQAVFGIQNPGYPIIYQTVEDLSTGAIGQSYLDYQNFSISINDGGLFGYQIQHSYNNTTGTVQLALYDPVATLIQESGVTGGNPYVTTNISDSVTDYHVNLTATSWKVYGDQNNFQLVNSDASDYLGYPFAGSIAVDGFITVINGVYNYGIGSGGYIASLEYFDSDTGDDILITVDISGINLLTNNGTPINMNSGAVNMTAAIGANESKWIVDSSGITCITHNSATLFIDELTGNVRLYKAHNNAMAFGNASNPELRSGSDTSAPTVTGTVNITSVSSPTNHKFSRVGNEVTGSFRVTIDPAATGTASQIRFTLPITSNIANADDVSGVAFSGSINTGGEVTGDAANNAGYLDFISDGVGAAKAWTIFYQYTIKN